MDGLAMRQEMRGALQDNKWKWSRHCPVNKCQSIVEISCKHHTGY